MNKGNQNERKTEQKPENRRGLRVENNVRNNTRYI